MNQVPLPIPNQDAEKLFYYTDSANQPVGPVPFSVLLQLAAAGVVRPVDYVREKGTSEWVPFHTIKEHAPSTIADIAPPPLPPVQTTARREAPPKVPGDIRGEIKREFGISNDGKKGWLVNFFYPAGFVFSRLGLRFTKPAGIVLYAFVGLVLLGLLVNSHNEKTSKSPTPSSSESSLQQQASSLPSVAKSFAPQIELTALQEGAKFVVRGKTNLPDTTELYMDIQMAVLDEPIVCGGPNFTVRNGAFEAVRQNPRIGVLPSGDYRLKLSCYPMRQKPDIQRLFGKNGENLTGPLIINEFGKMKSVRVTEEIKVTGPEAERAREEIANTVVRLKHELRALWHELDFFKEEDRFLDYGFAPAGHQDWANRVQALEKTDTTPTQNLGGAGRQLLALGMEYFKSKGEDTPDTRDLRLTFQKFARLIDEKQVAEGERKVNEEMEDRQRRHEKIAAKAKDALGGNVKGLIVNDEPDGGYSVQVDLSEGVGWSANTQRRSIENATKEAYRKLFTAPNFSPKSVTIAVWAPFTDKSGGDLQDVAFKTSIDAQTAARVHWDKFHSLDFGSLWKVLYQSREMRE